MPQELRHAGEGPAATVGVTDKRPLTLGKKSHTPRLPPDLQMAGWGRAPWLVTCVASGDFQAAGFVVLFAASRKGEKSSCSPEVARLWKQSATVMQNASRSLNRETQSLLTGGTEGTLQS